MRRGAFQSRGQASARIFAKKGAHHQKGGAVEGTRAGAVLAFPMASGVFSVGRGYRSLCVISRKATARAVAFQRMGHARWITGMPRAAAMRTVCAEPLYGEVT